MNLVDDRWRAKRNDCPSGLMPLVERPIASGDGLFANGDRHEKFKPMPAHKDAVLPGFVLGSFVNVNRQTLSHTPLALLTTTRHVAGHAIRFLRCALTLVKPGPHRALLNSPFRALNFAGFPLFPTESGCRSAQLVTRSNILIAMAT